MVWDSFNGGNSQIQRIILIDMSYILLDTDTVNIIQYIWLDTDTDDIIQFILLDSGYGQRGGRVSTVQQDSH